MKLQYRYTGPHQVVRTINPVLYLCAVDGQQVRVHANRMKHNPAKYTHQHRDIITGEARVAFDPNALLNIPADLQVTELPHDVNREDLEIEIDQHRHNMADLHKNVQPESIIGPDYDESSEDGDHDEEEDMVDMEPEEPPSPRQEDHEDNEEEEAKDQFFANTSIINHPRFQRSQPSRTRPIHRFLS